MTRSARRAMSRSVSTRCGGLVSLAPWWRRLTDAERVEGVHDRDAERARRVAARRAPDIQKCAWTTSGGAAAHCARSCAANAAMYGSSSSLGTSRGGPASTWSTAHARRERDAPRQRRVVAARVDDDLVAARAQRLAPAPRRGRSGRRHRRRRARRAGWRARRPCAILIGSPPPRARRPSRPGSARARSARARRPGRRGRARAASSGSRTSRAHGVGQHVDPGRDDAGRRRAPPRAPRSSPSATTGMPEVHRLEQRQAERGPADRVQVDAPARHLRRAARPAAGRRSPPERPPRPSRTGRAARPRRSGRAGPCR